jgi:hypothetical protein
MLLITNVMTDMIGVGTKRISPRSFGCLPLTAHFLLILPLIDVFSSFSSFLLSGDGFHSERLEPLAMLLTPQLVYIKWLHLMGLFFIIFPLLFLSFNMVVGYTL